MSDFCGGERVIQKRKILILLLFNVIFMIGCTSFVKTGLAYHKPMWTSATSGQFLDISTDGKYLVAANLYYGEIHIWDTSNSNPIRNYSLPGADTATRSVSMSDDGKYIAAVTDVCGGGQYEGVNRTYLFDKDLANPSWYYDDGSSCMWCVDISADGQYIIASEWNNGHSYLFARGSSIPLWNFNYGTYVEDVAISGDGNYIVVGYTYRMFLFQKSSNIPLWNYSTGAGAILSVDISPDGHNIVCGAGDALYVFNRSSNIPTWQAAPSVRYAKISPDGQYIVGGSYSGYVYLFENSSATPLWSFGQGDEIESVAISSNGDYAAAVRHDQTSGGQDELYVFAKNGSVLWTYQNSYLVSVTMSDDGKSIAVGGPSLFFFDRIAEPDVDPDNEISQDLVSLALFALLACVIIRIRSFRKANRREFKPSL